VDIRRSVVARAKIASQFVGLARKVDIRRSVVARAKIASQFVGLARKVSE